MQGGHDGTHNLQPSMTGESSLYHIIYNDGPAGPTWTGAQQSYLTDFLKEK